jgi:hypothetical protein
MNSFVEFSSKARSECHHKHNARRGLPQSSRLDRGWGDVDMGEATTKLLHEQSSQLNTFEERTNPPVAKTEAELRV